MAWKFWQLMIMKQLYRQLVTMVTQAVCLRITDEASLRSIGIEEMDTVIVAMGENIAQSILITALLKKSFRLKRLSREPSAKFIKKF